MTGIAHGGLPEKEVSFGPDGQYIRVPMYRTFYRNYGVVKVEKDENRKPGTKTPSNLFETSIITEDSIKVGISINQWKKTRKTIVLLIGGGI